MPGPSLVSTRLWLLRRCCSWLRCRCCCRLCQWCCCWLLRRCSCQLRHWSSRWVRRRCSGRRRGRPLAVRAASFARRVGSKPGQALRPPAPSTLAARGGLPGQCLGSLPYPLPGLIWIGCGHVDSLCTSGCSLPIRMFVTYPDVRYLSGCVLVAGALASYAGGIAAACTLQQSCPRHGLFPGCVPR